MVRGALCTCAALAIGACSTKSNTAGSRAYHAMTARYNTGYNACLAYAEGVKHVEQSFKDDSTHILPMLMTGNDSVNDKANFDRAIEKAQKAISAHSIRRKPLRKQGKRYSDSHKRWLASREFNPYMHHAWMLMGKAQFMKGDMTAAAATFIYTSQLYKNDKEVQAEALIRLAQCYTMMDNYYDAEEALGRINQATLPRRLAKLHTAARANLLIRRGDYTEAMPCLDKTIKNEKSRSHRLRLKYIASQLKQEMARAAATARAGADSSATMPGSAATLSLPRTRYADNRHAEDSLYTRTYEEYLQRHYTEVLANAKLSAEKFPAGKHRPKFIFLDAMSQLATGHQDIFMKELKELVDRYPENEITEMATYIISGVNEGRLLRGVMSNPGELWSRHRGAAGDAGKDADSTPRFSMARDTTYLLVLAYEAGTVDEHRMLYEVARHNFATYAVKEFDISQATAAGIGRMVIGSFASIDEAAYYTRRLYADEEMSRKLDGLRAVIISAENYELLNKYYSFDEYEQFYGDNLESTISATGGSSLDDPINNLPADDMPADDDDDDSDAAEPDDKKTIIIY
jgi:tetratricopeptide (TPR) repeat protein